MNSQLLKILDFHRINFYEFHLRTDFYEFHLRTTGSRHLSRRISTPELNSHQTSSGSFSAIRTPVGQPSRINSGSSSALAPMWTPPTNENGKTNSGGPLVNLLLGGRTVKSSRRMGKFRPVHILNYKDIFIYFLLSARIRECHFYLTYSSTRILTGQLCSCSAKDTIVLFYSVIADKKSPS